jgi:hypothetical protein
MTEPLLHGAQVNPSPQTSRRKRRTELVKPKVVFVELRTLRYGLQAVEKVELWIASGSREDQTATLVHFRPPRLETLHQLFRTGISRSLYAFGVHRSCLVLATILVVVG